MDGRNVVNPKKFPLQGRSGVRKVVVLTGFCWSALCLTVLTVAGSTGTGTVPRGQDKDGAGVVFSKQATSKEVGLPVYPGAKLRKDEKEDSASVNMGIWGSTFGFKLAVMKMESNDAPEKIAEFYKKALGKYGTVLNCSDTSKNSSGSEKNGSSNKLECDDDKPENGELVFKAGTKEKQHVVAIQANGQGSLFQLVYVEARSDDKEKKAN
jgi:hypothetical protein